MNARLLTVIGGGEHARVVIEAARSRPELWQVEGFADPQPCEETQRRLDVVWLGDDTRTLSREPAARLYVVAVGAVGHDAVANDLRAQIVERYAAAGASFAAIVHARAFVSPTARIEDGAVVFAGAIVQSGARIGAHAIVNTGAIAEHDVQLGAFAHLGPGAHVGGGAVIGEHAYLGLGCRVRDHVKIGARALVAMGAVVTANVDAGALVLGVPARPQAK
ncbi:MAG TPA: acetyltransferase [Kofleriaceae bacterium]